jgi:hypothetical protein
MPGGEPWSKSMEGKKKSGYKKEINGQLRYSIQPTEQSSGSGSLIARCIRKELFKFIQQIH